MSYELDFSLKGLSTGLTLNAQLVNTVGTNVGSAVTTGFTEIGDGFYLWHASAIPDDHRGGVKIYEQGVPGTILFFDDINPEKAERIDAMVSSRVTLGTGAIKSIYTVTEDDGVTAIADVDVWVSSNEEGTIVIASGRTDAEGKITFWLDPGTVWVWRQKTGWNFVNPDEEVVE